MPTILRQDGLRIVIYPNDHHPDHVHAIGAGVEAVFDLNCPEGPVSVRESFGFSARRLREVAVLLDENIKALCHAWRNIHDH